MSDAKPNREPSKFPQQSLKLDHMDQVLNHVEWLLRNHRQVAIVEDGDGWRVSTTLRPSKKAKVYGKFAP
ncbi:hypothetical protein ACN9MB_08990 [Dyella kyungheensis]|uniref:hypothetical protein n=1 Tax=Dyella kyungheensis TaxID=1242174 RepID=UPI003CED4A7F